MRFTIPGDVAVHARKIARLNDTTRADWWRTVLLGDRLRGIGNRNGCRPVSVHRERVRFGAWEERPRVSLSAAGRYQAFLAAFRALVKAAMDVYLQSPAAVAAMERSLAQTGTGEGPPISGPENAYKCEGEL